MTESASPADTTTFTGRAEQRLLDIKTSVMRALDDLESVRWHAHARLRAKRERAQSAAAARRRDMEQAIASMMTGLAAGTITTAAVVAGWKMKGEVERLEHRAQRAEEYASAAVNFASGAVEEASAAVLDAIVARMDANAAKKAAARHAAPVQVSPVDEVGLLGGTRHRDVS